MRESTIENSFVRKAKLRGWLIKKLEAGRVSNGWPDRMVCLPGGVVVFIEFKAPGGKLTPLQAHVHRKLTDAGHLVYTCFDAESAIQHCLAALQK